MRVATIVAGLLTGVGLAGCAADNHGLRVDACSHTPGCVSTEPASPYGSPHARAVAPSGPGGR